MDLTTFSDPFLNYSRWFYCYYGATPDDTLEVIVSNGITSVIIDKIGSDPSQFFEWIPKSKRILDYITLTNSMQVSFKTSDIDPDVNITEGGVDYFYISNSNVIGINENVNSEISVLPNPFQDILLIKGVEMESLFELFNLQGQMLLSGKVTASENTINTQNLPSGMLFLRLNNEVYKVMKE
jgi:hypothetical protein